jgi:HMG-box domain
MEVDSDNPNLVSLIMGKPSRPLNSYNLFFRFHRDRILTGETESSTLSLGTDISSEDVANICTSKRYENGARRNHRKTHGKIGFTELSKIISRLWKTTDARTRQLFEDRAAQEKRIYDQGMKRWLKRMQDTKKYLQEIQLHVDSNKIAHKIDTSSMLQIENQVASYYPLRNDETDFENRNNFISSSFGSGKHLCSSDDIWTSRDTCIHDDRVPSSFPMDLLDELIHFNEEHVLQPLSCTKLPQQEPESFYRPMNNAATVIGASSKCWINTRPSKTGNDGIDTHVHDIRVGNDKVVSCMKNTRCGEDFDRVVLVRHGRVLNEADLVKFNLQNIQNSGGDVPKRHNQYTEQKLISSPPTSSKQIQMMRAKNYVQHHDSLYIPYDCVDDALAFNHDW